MEATDQVKQQLDRIDEQLSAIIELTSIQKNIAKEINHELTDQIGKLSNVEEHLNVTQEQVNKTNRKVFQLRRKK